MKRGAEFLVFCVLAACMHLAIIVLLDSEEEVFAGVAGGGATAMGASGDLADLIKSWEGAPDARSVADQADAPRAETIIDPPENLTSLAPANTDASNLLGPVERPKTERARPKTPMSSQAAQRPHRDSSNPPTAIETRHKTPVAELPTVAPLPSPQQDLVIAALPSRLPDQATSLTDTAPPLAQPLLQDPKDIGPAPLIAALPKAKPNVPEWAKRKPRQQPVKKAKTPKKQPTNKQPADQQQRKQQRQAQPATQTQTAARLTQSQQGQQGTAKKPSAGGTGPLTALKPGTAGSATAGQGFSQGQIKDAEARYVRAVHQAIAQRKQYPRKAKRRGITGKASIRVTLDAAGNLLGVSLAKSSGSDLLDQAALTAANRVGRYPRIPKEMGRSKVTIRFGVPFQLN